MEIRQVRIDTHHNDWAWIALDDVRQPDTANTGDLITDVVVAVTPLEMLPLVNLNDDYEVFSFNNHFGLVIVAAAVRPDALSLYEHIIVIVDRKSAGDQVFLDQRLQTQICLLRVRVVVRLNMSRQPVNGYRHVANNTALDIVALRSGLAGQHVDLVIV